MLDVTQQQKDSEPLPLLEDGDHCIAKETINDSTVVAAYLWYDGYIALPDQTAFIPIDEVLYTQGRPEREAVRGGTADCISDGGIPILSDRLYQFIESLADDGTVGQIIYRGHNQAAYDTIQRGFTRFLPTPTFAAVQKGILRVDLPDVLPDIFTIETTVHVVAPKPRLKTECHIGLSPEALHDLAHTHPKTLVAPLRRTG